MKQIVIMNDISEMLNPVGGPSICMKLLQNEIKKQSTEIVMSRNYEITNSLIWHWSPIYEIELIQKLISNNNIIICGPNSFFKGGDITEYEKYLIENKIYKYLFLHPKQYAQSEYFSKYIDDVKIYDIIYPVDPKCYVWNETIERCYDVLFYKKFGCEDTYKNMSQKLSMFKCNTIEYGKYNIDELVYLSSRSKCCIYLSCGETGGTACAEMFCNGCPIISYYGNLTYGDDGVNCIKIPDNGTFICNSDVILSHVHTCFSMNNRQIAENARNKFDVTKIAKNIISLLLELSKCD